MPPFRPGRKMRTVFFITSTSTRHRDGGEEQHNHTGKRSEKKLLRLFADDANELAVTFKVYCESSFRKQDAAEALHLHRNTLTYRLDKIERSTGLNIRRFSDAMTFRLITYLYKLLK